MAEQPHCTLVSGPAGSGKSRWAEVLAQRSGRRVCYLATGPLLPDDPDWQERLRRHRQRRPSSWTSQEVGLALAAAISDCREDELALVDSLGTWVAAGLDLDAAAWDQEVQRLLEVVRQSAASLILVGEEAAWGVIPATRAGCLFRDRLGQLLQLLMTAADAAWLVINGRAINLLSCSEAVPQLEPL